MKLDEGAKKKYKVLSSKPRPKPKFKVQSMITLKAE